MEVRPDTSPRLTPTGTTPRGNQALILNLATRVPALSLVTAATMLNIHRDTVRRAFNWLVTHGYARFINPGKRGRGHSLTIAAVELLHERQEERHAHVTRRP